MPSLTFSFYIFMPFCLYSWKTLSILHSNYLFSFPAFPHLSALVLCITVLQCPAQCLAQRNTIKKKIHGRVTLFYQGLHLCMRSYSSYCIYNQIEPLCKVKLSYLRLCFILTEVVRAFLDSF